jgi:hypothetical protein
MPQISLGGVFRIGKVHSEKCTLLISDLFAISSHDSDLLIKNKHTKTDTSSSSLPPFIPPTKSSHPPSLPRTLLESLLLSPPSPRPSCPRPPPSVRVCLSVPVSLSLCLSVSLPGDLTCLPWRGDGGRGGRCYTSYTQQLHRANLRAY